MTVNLRSNEYQPRGDVLVEYFLSMLELDFDPWVRVANVVKTIRRILVWNILI